MAKHVTATEVKARLPALLSEVEHTGTHIVIERRKKPVAALIPIERTAELMSAKVPDGGRGALALVGIWSDLTNDEVDAIVADIYRGRQQAEDRPVDLSAFEP